MPTNEKIVLALPKGRILCEVMPLVRYVGIEPESSFEDENSRQLRFCTNHPDVDIIRVRSFDIATFVAFGGAQIGIAGNDVLMEFSFPEIYTPLDLKIGQCRLSVAEPMDMIGTDDPMKWSSVRIATKYPELTRRHFATHGVQAECIKLNGALELAPHLGLCNRIVDLVATGETLKANGLAEVEVISNITSRVAVNRAAWKIETEKIAGWVEKFKEAADALAT
tara:strand:+ start:190 stop:858 length:669 start_codon:yes stop_codon:yes gene_type:complete